MDIICLDIGAAGEIPEHWVNFSNKTNIPLNVFAFDENPSKDKNNKHKNININFLPFLLGEKEETRKFYILKRDTGSSIYKLNENFAKEFHYPEYHSLEKTIDVKLTTLNKLILEKKILSPHVIKLDTQGSELDILKGMKSELSKIILVETEVEFIPLYKNQPLFNDIDMFLKKNDFDLFDLRTGRFFHTNGIKRDYYIVKYGGSMSRNFWTSRLIAGDALYIKNQEWLEKQTLDIIDVYFNILAMYKCFDRALYLLDQLIEKSIVDNNYYNNKKLYIEKIFRKNIFVSLIFRFINRVSLKFGPVFPLIGNQYYGWTYQQPPDS